MGDFTHPGWLNELKEKPTSFVFYNLYKKEVDVEEEKRLLYVGMTRARRFLYLTFAKKRGLPGRIFRFQKSEFAHRIQDELIEKEKNSAQKSGIKKNNQLSLFN